MNDANDGKFIIEYLGGVGYRISDIGYLGWYRISFFLGFVTLVFKHVELKGKFPHSTLLIATILFHLLEPENTSLSKFAKGKKYKIVNGQSKMKVQYARYRRALYFHETVYKLVVKNCLLKLRYLYVSHHIS